MVQMLCGSGFTSFNPCYDGFVFLTAHTTYHLNFSTCFNPCYDGFVFLTWLWLSVLLMILSFNPCYDGFVFLTCGEGQTIFKRMLFQSLLWWICLFDHPITYAQYLANSGFNPCYDGFVFLTNCSSTACLFDLSFNPCYDGFVFLTYYPIGLLTHISYVSILVMMDLSFWQVLGNNKDMWYLVSILVMMDLSFWPFCRRFSARMASFNPCYDGFVFLTLGIISLYSGLRGFNPCYDGFVFLTLIWLIYIL